MRVRLVVAAICGAVALFCLWLLLDDTFERPELVAGAAASVIATAAALRSLHGEVDLRALARGLRPVAGLPLAATRDTALVLGAVLLHVTRIRPVRGRFVETEFAVGTGRVRDSTRCALATMTRSFPPNTSVVGFRRGDRVMVAHSLIPRR